MEADEKIKRVDIEERQSSLLSPFPSLFPTIIFDIVCYFCGIFITKSGGFSKFSGRPSLLCGAVQTASVRVDTPRRFVTDRRTQLAKCIYDSDCTGICLMCKLTCYSRMSIYYTTRAAELTARSLVD